MQKIEIAQNERIDLGEFQLVANLGARHLKSGAVQTFDTGHHLIHKFDLIRPGKFQRKRARIVFAIDHVLDTLHVLDQFDVQQFEQVLIFLNSVATVINVKRSCPSAVANYDVFVGFGVTHHAEKSIRVFLDPVVDMDHFFLDFVVQVVEIETLDGTELSGAEVPSSTVPPEGRFGFHQLGVDFAHLGEHDVQFLFVLGNFVGDDVAREMEGSLDVVAGAAVFLDGGAEYHGAVIGIFGTLEQIGLHELLLAEQGACRLAGFGLCGGRLRADSRQRQHPHCEK